MLAAGFTGYAQTYESLADPLSQLYLGLPLEALSEEAGAVADGVRRWLVGADAWQADARPFSVTVETVKIHFTGRPARCSIISSTTPTRLSPHARLTSTRKSA